MDFSDTASYFPWVMKKMGLAGTGVAHTVALEVMNEYAVSFLRVALGYQATAADGKRMDPASPLPTLTNGKTLWEWYVRQPEAAASKDKDA